MIPGISRAFVRKGARFLVNITNDAWFSDTSSPYQHMIGSVFRAVENRVCVVRAANTGISAFIDDKGRIISVVEDESGRKTFITGYDTHEVSIAKDRPLSFYTRYADIFLGFCLFVVLYGIIKRRKGT